MQELDPKLSDAFDNFGVAETNSAAVWKAEEEVVDEFASDIKGTAKILMTAIKDSAGSAYGLEAKELAQLTKAVCDLQNTFYGKQDAASTTIIQTNQLSMFKGML